MKKSIKIISRVLLILITLLLFLILAVQLSPVQNWLARMATKKLSDELKTEVHISNVSFSPFDKLNLENILIRDKHRDTLLFAGELRVRITDWFFIQDKADIKFIGLEDAVIHLNRTTKTWNYQYIIDHFAKTDTSKSSKQSIYFNLRKVDLKNVAFYQKDGWVGEDLTIKVDGLLLDANKMDVDKSKFSINSLLLQSPVFSIYDYDGQRPDSVRKRELREEKPTALRFNPGMLLRIDSVKIRNGLFSIDSDTLLPVTHFDGSHIKVTQINGVLNHLFFNKDTLRSVLNLACKERSGFEIKKLKAQLRITPEIVELSKLDLRTAKSHVGDYYAMHFKHFNENFRFYNSQVTMEGHIKDSKVTSDDVSFFAPELKHWRKEVTLSGNFLGSVSDFTVKKLYAKSDETTNIEGDFAMKGLPNIDKTIISFPNGTIKTNSEDLAIFIPLLKDINEPNVSALGTMLFRGSFLGTLNDFKTKGVLSTNIGAVDAEVAMQFPKGQEASYQGVLNTHRFHLGKFVNSSQLGLVDFNGKIEGNSFDLDKINTSLKGVFTSLEFNGYNYSNITTDGILLKNYFNGDIKVDDPNLDFTGYLNIDLSKSTPGFNIIGDLHTCNFKELLLTHDNVELTGMLDLNFKGRNIDNFVGIAKLMNANLKHENNRLTFDSLVLNTSNNENGHKALSLNSNEFSLVIAGKNFQLLDLPATFQVYLSHYFPSYFVQPTSIPANQDFKLTFTTKEFDSYAKIIDKKLSGFDYAQLSGNINTNLNKFSIEATVPSLRYDKYLFTDANISSSGTLDTLKLKGDITNIRIGDSLNFPNTTFSTISAKDYSDVQLRTKAENTLNEVNLNAGLTSINDGVKINFNPSYFVLNNKKWNLENEGEIIFSRDYVTARDVKFTQGLQEIKVETEQNNEESNTDNLSIKLKNLVIGDVTSLFMKSPQFEGLANGEVKLKNFFGAFNAQASIKTEQVRMDADSVGVVNLSAGYDSKSGVVDFAAKSPNASYNLNADGHYDTKDTTGNPLYVNTNLNSAKASFVQRFLGDIFSDINGEAVGNLIIKGNPDSPELLGKIKVTNAGLRVNYTQVYYTIDSATIYFEDNGINLGTINVKDKYKNKGVVKGKLYEKGFKDMYFDFTLNTNKLLLNDTKAKDNKMFYGKAIGKAKASFQGLERSTVLKMTAEANDSSHIFIPSSINKETGDADFIVFKKYGTEMKTEEHHSNFDLAVDLDLTANKFITIDVILDEQAGDAIKATGDGRLKITAGTTAPFNMKGRYAISQGSYDFNFQSFIRKPFLFLPETDNYIEWTGDPLNADIHIDAQYTAESVSVGDLLSAQQVSVSTSTKSYRGKVFVIASLREKLSKPLITFNLDFPQGSPVKTDAVFNEFLSRIASDQSEMLSQATSLIVFGTFAPYGQGLLTSNTGSNSINLGVNTISQLVSKQVNKAVSNLLFKITGDKGLRFDLGTSVYSSSSILDQSSGLNATTSNNKLDRTNINFKVGKSFFNDNVIVSFGGDLDFNLGTTSAIANGNMQWLPDLNIELVLSQDKRLRAIVFSKNNLDISGSTFGRINRQGVSLSYKRDFDKLFALKPKEMIIPKREEVTDDELK